MTTPSYLFLIAIILILAVVVANIFIPRKIKNSYLLWLPIGIFVLIWFIGFRWAYDLYQLISYNGNDIYLYSIRWSKVLLLDFCPLSTVLLSLSLIIDKTRNVAKVVSPIGLIGGLITLFSFVVNPPSDFYTVNLWEYIFIGTNNNQVYYLMHLINCMLSIGIITASKTYTKYSVFSTIIFYLVWVAYMQICINTLSITNNATGMVEGDWYKPTNVNVQYWYSEYGYVYELLPINFPGVMVFWYAIALIVNFLIMYIWNRFCFDEKLISKKFDYWHKRYKKLEFLNRVDNWFNKCANHIPNFLKNNR